MANLLIDVGHPAHVHLFRNAALRWRAAGHEILFSALDREMILHLLDHYELPFRVTYKRRRGKLALSVELLLRTWATYRIARSFGADLFVSFGSPTVGLPAKLMGRPYLALTDTEHATEQHALFKPFANVIATPETFKTELGRRQIRYPGFHELAYLHPDEFTPDPSVLESVGLAVGDTFFIVRFVAWNATHDIGQHGLNHNDKRMILRELSESGQVFLTVEGEVDAEFAPCVRPFPMHCIHDLLALATLYIGEGGTMVTEAAVLGTPAILVSTMRAGNWDALRDRYGLMYFYDDGDSALAKMRELLATPNLKQVWAQRRAAMLADKIDPTPWLVEQGERLLRGEAARPVPVK